MSEFEIKLSAALPKGDPNGWADPVLAEDLARTVTEGRSVQPRVAVIVYDVKAVNVGTDGKVTATTRVRRVQPVTSLTNRRALEQVLLSEYREQTGAAMLPFDVEAVTKQAFVDLPKTNEEIDQQEADEQDRMSPTDELRRHLERVHGLQGAHLMTAEEATSKHDAEHDGDMPEALQHDREWLGWTRVDLEAAQAENDRFDPSVLTGDADVTHEEDGSDQDPDDEDEDDQEEYDDPDSPHPIGTGEQVGTIPGVDFSGSRN